MRFKKRFSLTDGRLLKNMNTKNFSLRPFYLSQNEKAKINQLRQGRKHDLQKNTELFGGYEKIPYLYRKIIEEYGYNHLK